MTPDDRTFLIRLRFSNSPGNDFYLAGGGLITWNSNSRGCLIVSHHEAKRAAIDISKMSLGLMPLPSPRAFPGFDITKLDDVEIIEVPCKLWR